MAKGRKRSVVRQTDLVLAPEVHDNPRPIREQAVNSLLVTRTDLMNHFCVKISFPELEDVPEEAKGYGVVGRTTVQELKGTVADKLFEADQILSTVCDMDLFRTDGFLLAPAMTLAEVLKTSRKHCDGDGVFLELNCVITEYWLDRYFAEE